MIALLGSILIPIFGALLCLATSQRTQLNRFGVATSVYS